MHRSARAHLSALLTAAVCLAGGASWLPARTVADPSPAAAQPGDPASPLGLMISSTASPDAVVVTLTFSRPAVYRFEESRTRLRLWIEGGVEREAFVDRELDSDVVKRIRFDEGARGTTVVFHLGRRFSAFSSSERRNPFQVVVAFVAEGAGLPPEPPAGEGPPGTPGSPPAGAPGGFPGSGRGAEETGGHGLGAGAPLPGMPEAGAGGLLRRVVIDPGHGGEEEGAVSASGLKEKDLVLDIARRLRNRLNEAGYAAALTREDDQLLGLDARAAVANRLKADFFLSIHANSSRRETAHGPETYFLSYGSGDAEARRIAMLENDPGGDGTDDGGGRRGKDDDLRVVLWEMAQAEHLASSSRLADLVQGELNRVGGTADRGVKQAPFRVLVGAAMPAVLVEVGFLTHGEEEKKLASGDHRDEIAAALAAAIERFRQERLAGGSAGPRTPGAGGGTQPQ